MNQSFTEPVVEQATLARLEGLGWRVLRGAESADFEKVLMEQGLRDDFARLHLQPPKLISGAFRVPDTERHIEKVM